MMTANLPDKRFETLPYAVPNYETPQGKAGKLPSLLPNLSFYLKLLSIVYSAGAKAHKNLYTGEEWVNSSLETIYALERCGVHFSISGLEHVMNLKTPCVFVSNHMSTLETFGLPCLIQPYRDVTFVVKESLLKYPYFGPVLASRDPIIVGRENPREDLAVMLNGAQERLGRGCSIIVFPQGSRSYILDEQHFNSIGVKMARKSGVPVIPVALRTSSWGNGKLVKDFGPVRPKQGAYFAFGEPMDVHGNGKDEHAAVLEFIRRNLDAWNAENPVGA